MFLVSEIFRLMLLPDWVYIIFLTSSSRPRHLAFVPIFLFFRVTWRLIPQLGSSTSLWMGMLHGIWSDWGKPVCIVAVGKILLVITNYWLYRILFRSYTFELRLHNHSMSLYNYIKVKALTETHIEQLMQIIWYALNSTVLQHLWF